MIERKLSISLEMQQIEPYEYLTRQDWLMRVIHSEFWNKFKFELTTKWCMYKKDSALENENPKFAGIFKY